MPSLTESRPKRLIGHETIQRAGDTETTRFEIRDVDAVLAQQLAEIQKEFPQSQLGPCAN